MTSAATVHFDSIAEQYDQVLPFFDSFAEQILQRISLPAAGHVLDVGVGRGALSARLLGQGRTVVAIDAAPRMIKLVRAELPEVDAHVMDATELMFGDETFGLVASAFVLHLVPEPLRALQEIHRVLKPAGEVAIVVPGRAGGEPDPWLDPLGPLFAEYRQDHADGSGRLGTGVVMAGVLPQLGLNDLRAATVEIALPVADGDTYWNFLRSHGAGTFINGLTASRREEFRTRLVAAVDDAGGVTLRRSATLWRGQKPAH